MIKIEQLQMEIEALSEEDFGRLRGWFVEKDWDQWDRQLESDVAAGKLDVLLDEASAAKAESDSYLSVAVQYLYQPMYRSAGIELQRS
jgi:hypothetical protein